MDCSVRERLESVAALHGKGEERKKGEKSSDSGFWAGKTTILYKLQCGEVVTTIPSK